MCVPRNEGEVKITLYFVKFAWKKARCCAEEEIKAKKVESLKRKSGMLKINQTCKLELATK